MINLCLTLNQNLRRRAEERLGEQLRGSSRDGVPRRSAAQLVVVVDDGDGLVETFRRGARHEAVVARKDDPHARVVEAGLDRSAADAEASGDALEVRGVLSRGARRAADVHAPRGRKRDNGQWCYKFFSIFCKYSFYLCTIFFN